MKIINNMNELNIGALHQLHNEIKLMAKRIERLIHENERANLMIDIEGKMSADRHGTVSKDVGLILKMAGRDGTSSTEILHQLSRSRRVAMSAVRQALQRMAKRGQARRIRRRWYAVEIIGDAHSSSNGIDNSLDKK